MPPQPARVDELKKRYEENPRRFFAPLANEYRKAGDLAAAIDLCRMHLEEQPGHLSGHIVFGQALFESSQPGEAKRIFEAALNLDPENLIALRHLGDIARGEGDAASARHWYQRVLEADPRNDEVTALIDSLAAPPPAPSVVVAEPHAPPPPPNYAEPVPEPVTEPTPIEVPASQAPTPIVPQPAVPPPAPRLSIGLMDLDLNLADSTAPTVDLLGVVSASPEVPAATQEAAPALEMPTGLETSAPFEAPPTVEPPAPEMLEPLPAFDEPLAPAIGESAAPEAELSLAETIPAGAELEVQDTSFGLPSAEEEPTFAVSAEPPAFGDSLDVTADLEPEPEGVLLVDDSVVEDTGASVAIGEPVTAPRPIETPVAPITPVEEVAMEPLVAAEAAAPATPADFDALFGNAPISDVTIGGEPETVAAAETGFVADSFVGREPTDEVLATAPDIQTPPSPFVTETMAELYLQQGFRDEALEVYRQLLAQNPGDAGLAERVKHLEHGTRSSLAIDSVSEEIEAAAKAEEIRLSGSILTVPETPTPVEAGQPPIVEPPTGPPPIIEMIPEPVRPAVPTPVVSAPRVAAGPTVRELFSRIAARRAVPGGGVAPVAATGVAADAATTMESGQSALVTPPERDEVAIAPGGAVDRVFGLTGVAAEDEGAALALAAAYGGVPAAPIKGQPTRRGSDELSLDAVFKDEDAALRQAGVQRQSSRLRFDQFFPGSDGGEAPAAPPPPSPDAPSDDIAQFTDWLKGLKQS